MAKRLFDISISSIALLITSPLWLFAAVGIALSSPGPIFYRATRIGRGSAPFPMLKFRTMSVGSAWQSEITAPGDSRVFPLGRVIRMLKIDELPQLLNILRGEMSIVGPRPESPVIVAEHYTDWMRETLDVRPGLTSVGALFGYSYGDELLDAVRPEETYVELMLPAKLALERAYLERADFIGDLASVMRTAFAIVGVPLKLKIEPAKADLRMALRWVAPSAFPPPLRRYLPGTAAGG